MFSQVFVCPLGGGGCGGYDVTSCLAVGGGGGLPPGGDLLVLAFWLKVAFC